MRGLLPSVLTVTTLGAASVLAWAPAADSADPKRAGIRGQYFSRLLVSSEYGRKVRP